MRVNDLLRAKGTAVATVAPDASVRDAVELLREHGYGALVVSTNGSTIDGLVSERDIVLSLAADGGALLDRSVADIMSARVHTCGRDADVHQIMADMTDLRVRHVPVVEDGQLAGLISIGDVVKARVGELEDEARHLTNYIATGR